MEQSLNELSAWWSRQEARYMDILDDYAGQELVLLELDSLYQLVLADPLLDVARSTGIGCQLTHAIWSLEKLILEFEQRGCNFELVCFQTSRFQTTSSRDDDFTKASLQLAREVLHRHVKSLKRPIFEFENASCEEWKDFVARKRPIAVFVNDPGVWSEADERQALLQTSLLHSLASQGLAIAVLASSDFRDTKIFSFLYDRRSARPQDTLNDSVVEQVKRTQAEMMDGLISVSGTSESFSNNSPFFLQVASTLASQSDENNFQATLYLFTFAHTLLSQVPFNLRAQPPTCLDKTLEMCLRTQLLPTVFQHLSTALGPATEETFDLDTNLFGRLLHELLLGDGRLEELFDPATCDDFNSTWSKLATLPDFAAFCSSFEAQDQPAPTASSAKVAVLPFTNEVFDTQLSSIHVDTAEPSTSSLPIPKYNTVFNDVRHWHSTKQIEDKKKGPETFWQQKKRLRSHQNFMKNLQRSAESLTGALGTPLKRQTIPLASSVKTVRTSTVHPGQQKKGGKVKMSKADVIKAEHAAKKEAQLKKDREAWWAGQIKLMSGQETSERMKTIEKLRKLPRIKEDLWLGPEALLYHLHLVLGKWSVASDKITGKLEYHITVARMALELLACRTRNEAQSKKLKTVFSALGLKSLLTSDKPIIDEDKQDLTFKFYKFKESLLEDLIRVDEDPVSFQLNHLGEWMDRSLGSKQDSRVDFLPDAWQIEVLDLIDRNSSMLLIAPTSSGKTFVSFYAMEAVLRSSDDGILVYLAPTKSLVNQTAAEVFARFAKSLPSSNMWAIHTRDYRVNNPSNCQVLVTVPEVLNILLLSPPLARLWRPRIKRVIFDEIHMISEEQAGQALEQNLLLCPAPVIGLSATIGQPERFAAWLASIQEKMGHEFSLVNHTVRYNALRKFSYTPPAAVPFVGLDRFKSEVNSFGRIHPLSALLVGDALNMPEDLSLESSDVIAAYDALSAVDEASIETLEPAKWFPCDTPISLAQVVRYEKEIKKRLQELAATPEGQLLVKKMASRLSGGRSRQEEQSDDAFTSDLLIFFCNLHANKMLPALLFCFDRYGCEDIAQTVTAELEQAEARWRLSSPVWASKLAKHKVVLKQAAAQQAKRAKMAKSRDAEELLRQEEDVFSNFDPDAPSEEFSFADTTRGYTLTDLEEDIRGLKRREAGPDWLYDALRRGIAIHHAGCNKAYRALVETLFRIGFLRVVIATGTLSMGINAPAKSVVFAGDSTYLTALVYRQCAGRAGRRGFDTYGNVIFYDFTLDRIHGLLLSRLPAIGGSFPLTTTLVLRLFNLLDGSKNAPAAIEAIQTLLQMPQLSVASEMNNEAIQHFLRFSIDYLIKIRLLDSLGRPLGLTGIATHLYFHSPANLVFCVLAETGVLAELCADFEQRPDAAVDRLLITLCHLFGRVPWRAMSDSDFQELNRRTPSRLILPPAPASVLSTIKAHTQEVIETFAGYASAYAQSNTASLGLDNKLPLSKRSIGSSALEDTASPFEQALATTSRSLAHRSNFVALSGHTDQCSSVGELVSTIRSGIHMSKTAVPSLEFLSATGGEHELNAYAFDFYLHGQLQALVTGNKLRKADVWFKLRDFQLVLQTIKACLEELLKRGRGGRPAEDEAALAEDTFEEEDLDPLDEPSADDFPRPANTSDADWCVYLTIRKLESEFSAKFQKTWA